MMQRLGLLVFAVSLSFLAVGGCNGGSGGGGNGDCPEPNTSIAVCDPDAGPFSLVIDNGFFPLVVGSESVLEGVDDEGKEILVQITVLDETEVVAGVTTRVVEEAEFEDGEVFEISRNFYAQAPDDTVCYFGEDVDIYEDGEIVSNMGEWRAGENGNLPGIIMPGDPQPDMIFQQEFAPGIAEDQAEVIALGEVIDVPAGMFDDTLTTEDCNPLDGGSRDDKVYVFGIGLAIDDVVELVDF